MKSEGWEKQTDISQLGWGINSLPPEQSFSEAHHKVPNQQQELTMLGKPEPLLPQV